MRARQLCRNGYSSTGVNTTLPPEPAYSPPAPHAAAAAASAFHQRPSVAHSLQSSFAYAPHRFDQPSTAAPMAPLARAENSNDLYNGGGGGSAMHEPNGALRRPGAPNFTTDPSKLKGELITTRLYKVRERLKQFCCCNPLLSLFFRVQAASASR